MQARQILTLGLLALIWGSSFLFIKWGVAEVTPAVVVAGRLGAGLLFLFGALLVRGQRLPGRRLWSRLLVVAIVNNVIPFFLIAWGEQYIASGVAAILNATTPLFSVILATTWGDESLSFPKVLGLLLGFVGVVVLIGPDLQDFFATNNLVLLGELAVIVASSSYAVGAVFGRQVLHGESPLQLATGQLLIAFLIVLPVALLPINRPEQLPGLRALLAIGALGFFGSGLAYVLFYSLLQQVGATRTVVVTYLLPIVAIFLGWFILGEALTVRMVIGMGLILFGVVLVNEVRLGARKMLRLREVRER